MIPPTTRRLDVYGTELAVAWDGAGWGRLRRGRTKRIPAHDRGGYALTHIFNPGPGTPEHVFFMVNLARHSSEGELLNTIAHEAYHGAVAIGHTHYLGDPIVNQEPYAYLAGWLTQWLWESRPRP